MASTISGSNAISGLGGADTNFDQVLENLRKVESTKLNKLQAWKSDWQLRYDAFTQIVDQVKTAHNVLSSLANKNNFVTKNAVSTDDAIVTAVANASADDVQHKITVTQMANNAVWANTSAVFSSKTDLINDTGEKQVFSFDYGGKTYSYDIPNNTTLDSFASMINNSANNPGIKVQLIQANGGYMYQIAGNSTGADKDLVIHNSGLKGMDATGTNSKWQTNNTLDLNSIITDPTTYTYRLTLNNGTVKDVTIKGDATFDDIKKTLENSVGSGLVTCDMDASGNLILGGVSSFTRFEKGTSAPTASSLKLKLNGDVANQYIVPKDASDPVTYTVTMEGGGTREIIVKPGTTYREFMEQLGKETATSSSIAKPSLGSEGWTISLPGVSSISGPNFDDNFEATFIDGSGTIDRKIDSASTTLTFTDETATLGKAGETLRYAINKPNGGQEYITIDGGSTYGQLKEKLVTAGLATDLGDGKIQIAGATSFTQVGATGGLAKITSKTESQLTATDFTLVEDADTGEWTSETPPDLEYSVTLNDGTVLTKKIESGKSMKDVIAELNNAKDWMIGDQEYQGPDLPKFELVGESGKERLQVKNIQTMSGPGITGQTIESDNWQIQTASNAKYFVDNWPVEMESASNSVSDVIEGVVFNITGEGAANLSVSTDIASVEQSIQTFLDAVNSVIYTVNELSKYDKDKEVTSYDPNDIGKQNYSTSVLTSEKGGLMTGNYGVQLFKSRFTSLLSSSPSGFQRIGSAEDVLSGDIVSTLASLGIKTDSDATSQTYGLLVIAPKSGITALQTMDQENYEDMINNHLREVVDFFCTTGSGASTSSDFRYGSHVAGITKAGVYDVTYSVSDAGDIEHVYVGGVEAVRDTSQPGYYYSVASGDARGLSFQIDDLTPGKHEGGQIRIKEGMIQTVSTWMKGELTYNDVSLSSISDPSSSQDAIHIMSQNGALMSLRANYQGIMNNIDKAISKEETRLDMWYNRQKKVFANLETLLKTYSQQEKSMQAQIKQLSGSSS